MSKKTLHVAIALFIIILTTAGTILLVYPYSPDKPPIAEDTGSTPQGISDVVNANNRFAFELYSQLDKTDDGNIFYSPYSISAALAMTYEGAKSQTAEEMKSVFHFPDHATLRPNFAAIYNSINEGSGDYELRTGNALWVQQDYPFLEDYLTTVENYYGGKAANLDFVNDNENSRQTINTFIEEQTNNKIKDLIPSGALSQMTRLVLTNAIYFKGTWEWEFDKSDTKDMDFRITPTDTVKVPMMYMDPDKASFNYADLDELQILELPYRGSKVSMLIMLPKENVNAIEPMTLENLGDWKRQLYETKLDAIYLPKFEFDTKYGLADALSALGMPTAFVPAAADFSGMDGSNNLYISSVIHQAYVKVDEKGTEAAAATAVMVDTTSVGPPPTIFRADHPFSFIIQEKETGNILFIGRVNDPRK